jgi:nucleoid DNA-binding protein
MISFRTQAIEKIQSYGLTNEKAIGLYNTLIVLMKDFLKINGELTLRNFGVFKVKQIKSRIVKSSIINNGNPTTTKEVLNIKFKISDAFKSFLNS